MICDVNNISTVHIFSLKRDELGLLVLLAGKLGTALRDELGLFCILAGKTRRRGIWSKNIQEAAAET